MADVEKLHFKISLSGTYWNKQPVYTILVNDKIVKTDTITAASDEVFVVEFDQELVSGPAKLQIRLENKDNSDTVQNEDKTEILKDLLLNIVNLEIDDINLGILRYSKSQFVGDDPTRSVMNECVNLGWNGTWTLSFESPFYIWLLENL
jgi:hypothetical protein